MTSYDRDIHAWNILYRHFRPLSKAINQLCTRSCASSLNKQHFNNIIIVGEERSPGEGEGGKGQGQIIIKHTALPARGTRQTTPIPTNHHTPLRPIQTKTQLTQGCHNTQHLAPHNVGLSAEGVAFTEGNAQWREAAVVEIAQENVLHGVLYS
jgi:hypothetical protein